MRSGAAKNVAPHTHTKRLSERRIGLFCCYCWIRCVSAFVPWCERMSYCTWLKGHLTIARILFYSMQAMESTMSVRTRPKKSSCPVLADCSISEHFHINKQSIKSFVSEICTQMCIPKIIIIHKRTKATRSGERVLLEHMHPTRTISHSLVSLARPPSQSTRSQYSACSRQSFRLWIECMFNYFRTLQTVRLERFFSNRFARVIVVSSNSIQR